MIFVLVSSVLARCAAPCTALSGSDADTVAAAGRAKRVFFLGLGEDEEEEGKQGEDEDEEGASTAPRCVCLASAVLMPLTLPLLVACREAHSCARQAVFPVALRELPCLEGGAGCFGGKRFNFSLPN